MSLLVELHTRDISPNGKYGIEMPTYKGKIPQYTKRHDIWKETFHHSIKWFVYTEEESQGPDDEMRELCNGLFEKVMPRLLRPLETGGRQIQPRLIHGDLWSGSTSTNIDTNTPVVDDGACLYAHNKSWYLIHLLLMCKNNEANQRSVPLEIAAWPPIRHKIGRHYMKAYFD